ncbi:hypothetical protein CTAYLR_000719 [Chrysophaeum taylorii]|uniref:RING-type domain-containing protein n=1 Tax=Chrysophaeum taylorii TaxID=2483200 RepID=A0AAD7U8P3_9STRA|nr:hypothetical protein CTAYLR_000719 [Chrysophaeum taylorii]
MSVEAAREDPGFIEWLARSMVGATEGTETPWSVCEIWRAGGSVVVDQKNTTAISLTLAASNGRECFSTMRAPRGHACARCLSNPLAAMLRRAVTCTFAPGIALVGRCWLLGQAEVIDVATAEIATYARAKIAAKAGLATAVAVPVVYCDRVTAVVIAYFERRVANTSEANRLLAAMLLAENQASRAIDIEEELPASPNFVPSVSLSPADEKCTDKRIAAKLERQQARRVPADCYPCPICFSTIERAVKIRACAHAACADCLARWGVLSPDCPSCGGFIDRVLRDTDLDREIARALALTTYDDP